MNITLKVSVSIKKLERRTKKKHLWRYKQAAFFNVSSLKFLYYFRLAVLLSLEEEKTFPVLTEVILES